MLFKIFIFIFFLSREHDEILVIESNVDVVFKNLNKRQLQKGVGVGVVQPL